MPSLPLSRQIAYSLGQLGWSTLVNLVGLQLVFFYIPPQGEGIPYYITQAIFLVVLNTVTLIAASGRLFDAITDPWIASLSDRSRHPRGRRIPFMAWSPIPAALTCALLFLPPVASQSAWNVAWVVVMQLLFFLFITIYVTPFFALLPELGHTSKDRLNLSTYISVTWALGLIVAFQAPLLWNIFSEWMSRPAAFQMAVATLCIVAVVFMYIPVLTIDEKRYSVATPSDIPMLAALKRAFRNKQFLYYVIADFAYFGAIMMIQTGMLYYTTVLLFPDRTDYAKEVVGQLGAIMVISSFLLYPAVNILARRLGKKPLVIGAFGFFGLVFCFIYFLGKWPISPLMQGYLLALSASAPMAFLGILPNAILADIAEHDGQKSGQRLEGMFFAARTFLQKMGVTTGILIFAALTTFGKDPGDDLGIRLSGPVGFALCLIAVFFFSRYDEKKILSELGEQSKDAS